jgi:hypothetical protein
VRAVQIPEGIPAPTDDLIISSDLSDKGRLRSSVTSQIPQSPGGSNFVTVVIEISFIFCSCF